MGSGSRLECRWCKRMCTPKVLRSRHGKVAPECVYYRSYSWMVEHEWRIAGRDARVLDLAGVTRQSPVGRPFYWEKLDDQRGYRQMESANFVTIAPVWATTLSRKLMDDQALVKKFGRFRLEDRSFTPREQAAQHALGIKEKGKKMVIPLEMRAKIIKVAADNAMTREFAADDLEAVLVIIRDTL